MNLLHSILFTDPDESIWKERKTSTYPLIDVASIWKKAGSNNNSKASLFHDLLVYWYPLRLDTKAVQAL